MLFDPDPGFVEEVTGGDVPLAEKVGKPGDRDPPVTGQRG